MYHNKTTVVAACMQQFVVKLEKPREFLQRRKPLLDSVDVRMTDSACDLHQLLTIEFMSRAPEDGHGKAMTHAMAIAMSHGMAKEVNHLQVLNDFEAILGYIGLY